MKTVYNSEYLDVKYDREEKMFYVIRPVPAYISDEEYKKEVEKWSLLYIRYKPVKQIVDMRENFYLITPEMQKWLNENLLAPAYKAGMRRVAFILSADAFAQTSIEQTMDENFGKTFQVSYFTCLNEAWQWLTNLSGNEKETT